jgi:hypothetical protein
MHRITTKLAGVLFSGALLAALSLIPVARADTCTEISGGTCKSHGTCDSSDSKKHCLDTLKKDGYHCECRKGTNDRPHESSRGPNINFGISLGLGHGGIGIDIGSGGYCDRWGCPDDYWDYPVFYGPVFYDDEWFEGPVYYRRHHGEYQYWIRGGWHYDQWEGDRPDWARDTYYGEALGRDYYESDEFRHGDQRSWRRHHGEHDGDEHGDHHGDHDGDHHDGDHGDHHDGDHQGSDHGDHHDGSDHHDKHGDKDKDKDKDKGKAPWQH